MLRTFPTPLSRGAGLFLLLAAPLFAQNHNAPLSQNFKFEQLTIEHGLPHNRVMCILQDSRGFMWFGTKDGLARYDGYSFKVYKHDPADSTTISNNIIWAIFEDQSSTLWIGTSNGLNEFVRASETFKRYLPNPHDLNGLNARIIRTIVESRRQPGILWLGSWDGVQSPFGGLYKFDRPDSPLIKSNESRGKFTRYNHDPQNPNSLSTNAVWCIVEDDSGSLWVGTQHGLNRFDPKTGTCRRYLPDSKKPQSLSNSEVWYGMKDQAGTLWFATQGGGLCRYDPQIDGFIRYQHDPKNPNSLLNNHVCTIFRDAAGKLWIGNGVLSRFDQHTNSFEHFRFSSGQNDWDGSFAPWAIYEDRAHNLWIGTRGSGVFKINLKLQKFTHYVHEPENANSLSDHDIMLFFEDSKGLLWIAIREGGLNRFDPKTEEFVHFKHDPQNPRTLSHNTVYPMYEDRSGVIWFGTLGGLNKFESEKKSFTRYLHDPVNPYSLSHDRIGAILEDREGALWVATFAGDINKFDRQAERFYRFNPDSSAEVISKFKGDVALFEDRHDNLWVSIFGTLYHFDRLTNQFTRIKAAQNDNPFWGGVDFFEDHRGTIWGRDYGLCKLDIDSRQFIRYRVRPNEKREFGFDSAYNTVQALYEDKNGMLWCGTRYGLHKFDPQQERFVAHYYEKDGLANHSFLRIIGDDTGKLWLLTNGGLSIFDESAPSGKQFTNLSAADGVINASYVRGALIKSPARRGEIYWGGANGIYRFYPEVAHTNPTAPMIRLTEFRKFNTPFRLDTSIAEIKVIRLPHDENFFSFAFSALDFTNTSRNRYAYKLEGLDRDWVQSDNKHEANYTHVPPGQYTFRVKGSNNDGVWNEEGTSVKIIITPPFRQTWWFRLLILAIIAGLLEALHKYRLSKKLEIERMRLRIARDLHDDVGSSLSSIALTAELLQKESVMDSLADRRLARVHETAQKLSRNLKEIVWAIDPQRDKFGDLLLHMKEAAEELLGQKGIAYTLAVPQDELPQSLKMEFRRNLFLIYKELLHNVVKHAEATKVEIALTRMNGTLQLQVADNGKGFGEEKVGNGNGLKSMRARAGELDGQLEINSGPERGTRVTFTVNCK